MSPESGRWGRGLHASMSTCKGGGRDRCKFFGIFDPSIDIAIIRIIANMLQEGGSSLQIIWRQCQWYKIYLKQIFYIFNKIFYIFNVGDLKISKCRWYKKSNLVWAQIILSCSTKRMRKDCLQQRHSHPQWWWWRWRCDSHCAEGRASWRTATSETFHIIIENNFHLHDHPMHW